MTSPIAEHIVAVGLDGVVREVSDISEVHGLKEHVDDGDDEGKEKGGEDVEALASALVPITEDSSVSELADANTQHPAADVADAAAAGDPQNQEDHQKRAQVDGKLILAEEIEEGHVSWRAIKLYFKGLGGSTPLLFVVVWVGGMFVLEGCVMFSVWFLGYWGTQYETKEPGEVSNVR